MQRSPDVKFVAVNQGAAGATVLKAAVAGRRYVLVGFLLTMSAAGTLKFRSGSGANDITGAMTFPANALMPADADPDSGFCETNVGESLELVTTVGLAKGVVAYREENG